MSINFRTLLIIIVIFSFGKGLNAQKLIVLDADMSSSDKRKEFISIGNSSGGYLSLLDETGLIWLYDGYKLTKWNSTPIDKPNLINQIFISDSTLFAILDDALVFFERDQEKPSLITRAKDPYFTFIQKEAGFVNNGSLYSFLNKKTTKIQKSDFPERKQNRVITVHNEILFSTLDKLHWRYLDNQIISSSVIGNVDQINIDLWGNNWLLQDGKIKRLVLERSSISDDNFNYKGEKAIFIKEFRKGHLVSYRNEIRYWQSRESVQFVKLDSAIEEFWLDNKEGLWIQDKDNILYHKQRDSVYMWNENEFDSIDKIVGFSRFEDVVSMILENGGIIQSRVQQENDDWIWVPHRLNSKLKNLGFAGFALRDDGVSKREKLFLFTENFGVYVIDQRELGIFKKGFPSYGIQAVGIASNYAIVLDKAKRWHRFIFGKKEAESFLEIKSTALPPEIQSKNFVLSGESIQYRSKNELITIDIASGQWERFPHVGKFDNVVQEGRIIRDFSRKKQYVFAPPAQIQKETAPLLLQVTAKTSTGKSVVLYPVDKEEITLLTSDLPLELTCNASYVADPKSIEYAWSSDQTASLDVDFQFDEKVKWKEANAGNYHHSVSIKIDSRLASYRLKQIKIEKVKEGQNNIWAIYLSGILAGLLILLFIGSKIRSNGQKRKIKQLNVDKRAMELEQKALQLQMNPHFIFNALNGVKGMIALGENRKARQYLTKISGWMRNMLNDARSDKVSVETELVNIKSYLEIEQELQGNKWDYEIQIDEHVNKDFFIPPMMIQPFIENAIVHAFKGIVHRGKIELRMKRKGIRIEVEIEDNGIGIQGGKATEHKSVALQVIKDRLKLLNEGTAFEGFSLINKAEYVGSGVIVKILLPILD